MKVEMAVEQLKSPMVRVKQPAFRGRTIAGWAKTRACTALATSQCILNTDDRQLPAESDAPSLDVRDISSDLVSAKLRHFNCRMIRLRL
ncbi:hypothetical protein MY4824_003703 [Beauveria thailandica]